MLRQFISQLVCSTNTAFYCPPAAAAAFAPERSPQITAWSHELIPATTQPAVDINTPLRAPCTCEENIWRELFIVCQTGIYSDRSPAISASVTLRNSSSTSNKNKETWLCLSAIYNSTVAISRHESALLTRVLLIRRYQVCMCLVVWSDQTGDQNPSFKK